MDVFGRNSELKLREVYDTITGMEKAATNASFFGKRNQNKLKFRHFKCDSCEGPYKTNECPEFQQYLRYKKNKKGTKNCKNHGPQTA